MKTFDWILTTFCGLWFCFNVTAVFIAASNRYVRSIEIKPMFFIPVLGLLFVAYRVLG